MRAAVEARREFLQRSRVSERLLLPRGSGGRRARPASGRPARRSWARGMDRPIHTDSLIYKYYTSCDYLQNGRDRLVLLFFKEGKKSYLVRRFSEELHNKVLSRDCIAFTDVNLYYNIRYWKFIYKNQQLCTSHRFCELCLKLGISSREHPGKDWAGPGGGLGRRLPGPGAACRHDLFQVASRLLFH